MHLGAGGGHRADHADTGGVRRTAHVHLALEVQGIAGGEDQIAAAVLVVDHVGDRVAALRLAHQRTHADDLVDRGALALLDRLTGDKLPVGIDDLIGDVLGAVDALLQHLRLALRQVVGGLRDRAVGNGHAFRFIISEVRGDLDGDALAGHVDHDHLQRLGIELQAPQQRTDRFVGAGSGVLHALAVGDGDLLALGKDIVRVGVLHAGNDQLAVRNVRHAVHRGRAPISEQIQGVGTQTGYGIGRDDQSHQKKEGGKARLTAVKSLFCSG